MWSPLGPILSNIFVCFPEQQVIKDISPVYYKRYVDDTFAIFVDDKDVNAFLLKLKGMHRNFEFIIEYAIENKLAFLDVMVLGKIKISIRSSEEKLPLVVIVFHTTHTAQWDKN